MTGGPVLLRLDWSAEGDVYAVRQRGRELAAALGLEAQDQVRVATALSEVGREVVAVGTASVRFAVDAAGRRLVVVVDVARPPGGDDLGRASGVAAARRLLSEVTVTDRPGGQRVVLVKALPRTGPLEERSLDAVRARMATLAPTGLLDELRAQNADLVATLDELSARQEELLRVNQELEETNHGVLAMFSQLSQELEETNRGVVALYAELDAKGQELADANEAKTRFLRNVSHELRSPVHSVLGLADLLAEGPLDAEQRVQATYLTSAARSLLRLVNELLDLARAESGTEVADLADLDLGALFGELRGTLRPVAQARGLDLDVPAPEVPPVRADAELLTRVLRNLLTNALKFTEHGRVRMTATARESGRHVEISVADTGIGIPPEHAERVFEEFYQVPGPLQEPKAGTGLGLAYARRVTEIMGGTLGLASEPGRGSTFTVTLPVPMPEADPGAPLAVEDGRLGHVLLVDDDDAFRHLVRGLLQGVAERVSEAGDGTAALELARRSAPDVVLLDLRMPAMDGPTTLAALRADHGLRRTPVVLLTSVDLDTEVRSAVEPVPVFLAKSQLSRQRLVTAVLEARARQEPPA